jgi:hypothetical protein
MKDVALRLLPFVLAVHALAGCDPSLELIKVPPGCPDKPLRGPAEFPLAAPEDVIDDFEDDVGPNDLSLSKVAGRNGSWVGVASPNAGSVSGETSTDCVAAGKRSGHLTGNHLNMYGSNWNGVFVDPFGQEWFDANDYSGFSFWVALGENAVPPFTMPIGLMTTDTSGPALICNPCGDYYRVSPAIPLTRTWTRQVVKFKDLTQSGMGSPQTPLKKGQLVSIMIWPQNTYDIWIDDVRFER